MISPILRARAGVEWFGEFRWYDVNACRPLLKREARPLKSSVLDTKIVQTTPEFSFSVLHRKALIDAPNVTVVPGMRVVRFRGGGRRIAEVEAINADGTATLVAADRFVLCAGGSR